MTDTIQTILSNVLHQNHRLTDEEALTLFQSPKLLQIGEYADLANIKKNGNAGFYNINRHLNPTNICALSCKFCAFSKKPGDADGYALDIDQITEKVSSAINQGAREIHMVGGLHPRWPFKYYLEIISAIKSNFPEVHLKAFTAVEVDWMAKKARKSIPEVLEDLKAAGLDSMPGGGAEIFHPEIRTQICDTKVSADQWIDTHRTAHKMGIRSNATMLYGHIESFEHRVDHMRRLRELQDETGGFNVFIPLSFQPHENEMGIDKYTYSHDDLKTLAIARLYLDNFNHIKSYWVMLGRETAQIGLNFGADDLDGTVTEEKISRMAGGQGGASMTVGKIRQLIANADKQPVERDTLYNPINKADYEAAQLGKVAPPRYEYNQEENSARFYEGLNLVNTNTLNELGLIAERAQKDAGWAKTESSFALGLRVFLSGFDSEKEFTNYVFQELSKHKLGNTPLVLDLTAFAAPWFHQLPVILKSLTSQFEGLQISLQGLTGFLSGIHANQLELTSFLSELRKNRLSTLESSYFDNENSLTLTEFISIHKEAHKVDLPTVAMVNLNVSQSSESELIRPLWEGFVNKLLELDTLAASKLGLLAIAIVPAKDCEVSGVDYLKAVSLARIVCKNIENIIAPIESLPKTQKALDKYSESADTTPAKLTSLIPLFGANDFGVLNETNIASKKVQSVIDQISSIGFKAKIRDLRFLSNVSEWQGYTQYQNHKLSQLGAEF